MESAAMAAAKIFVVGESVKEYWGPEGSLVDERP